MQNSNKAALNLLIPDTEASSKYEALFSEIFAIQNFLLMISPKPLFSVNNYIV